MASWKSARVIVTGGGGFLGSHLVERLYAAGCEPFVPRSADYDLRAKQGIVSMFNIAGWHVHDIWNERPDILFHLAAHCGGIGLNRKKPAELFYDNAMMGIQLIHEAHKRGVRKFIQVGTVCSYPKDIGVRYGKLGERNLWAGYPEKTNAPYGIAKKMLLVQLQAYAQQYGMKFAYALPTNLYGPRDNFDLETSHVIPAIIRKFLEAQEEGKRFVRLWGTGKATRDFLYVDDCAEALMLVAEEWNQVTPINIGSGREISILHLAEMIAGLMDFEGEIIWDGTSPMGSQGACWILLVCSMI